MLNYYILDLNFKLSELKLFFINLTTFNRKRLDEFKLTYTSYVFSLTILYLILGSKQKYPKLCPSVLSIRYTHFYVRTYL